VVLSDPESIDPEVKYKDMLFQHEALHIPGFKNIIHEDTFNKLKESLTQKYRAPVLHVIAHGKHETRTARTPANGQPALMLTSSGKVEVTQHIRDASGATRTRRMSGCVTIPPKRFADLVKGAPTRLFFLNFCHSYAFAKELKGTIRICWKGQVETSAARELAIRFYQYLHETTNADSISKGAIESVGDAVREALTKAKTEVADDLGTFVRPSRHDPSNMVPKYQFRLPAAPFDKVIYGDYEPPPIAAGNLCLILPNDAAGTDKELGSWPCDELK